MEEELQPQVHEILDPPVDSNELPKTSIPDFDVSSCSCDERERRWVEQRNEHGVVIRQLGILQLLVIELDQLQESSMPCEHVSLVWGVRVVRSSKRVPFCLLQQSASPT